MHVDLVAIDTARGSTGAYRCRARRYLVHPVDLQVSGQGPDGVSSRVGQTAWHLTRTIRRHTSVLHTRASGQGRQEPIGFRSPHFRKPTTEACD